MSHGCSGSSGSCSGVTGPSGGGGAQYGGGKNPPLWAVVSFLTFHLAVFALIAYGVAVPDNCPCAWTFSNGAMQYRDRHILFPEPTRPNGSLADLINRIKSAQGFIVTFDQAGDKFHDSGRIGNTVPVSVLQAGETYQITYFDGVYKTRGFNEAKDTVINGSYGNANPDEGKISLWGRVYTFDKKGNVYDPRVGLVGTLRFGEILPF